VSASFVVLGFTELAARLPAAVLGTACVLTTYWLGAAMFNRRVGLAGGVILATSLEYVLLCRVVVHDIALTLSMTLALLFMWLALQNPSRRRTHLLLFYTSAGLAVLAKGPLGLVLLAPILGVFLLLSGRLGFIREMGLVWGALIVAAVSATWYVPMMWRNPDYAPYFFIEHNLMNFVSSEPRHPEPFHFYLPILAGGLFPWSFFLPAALVRAWHQRHDGHRAARLFLLVWLAVVVLFFSAASSKLPTYVLPLFPAAALLVALAWDRTLQSRAVPDRGITVSLLALAVFGLAGLAYFLATGLASLQSRYEIEATAAITPVVALAIGLTSAALLHLWGRSRAGFATVAGTVLVLIGTFHTLVVPAINPFRTSRDLAVTMDALVAPGEPLVFFQGLRDSALFYTDRRASLVWKLEPMLELLLRDGDLYYVTSQEFWQRYSSLSHASEVAATQGEDLLLRNRVQPPG